jgi:hypothetical protein
MMMMMRRRRRRISCPVFLTVLSIPFPSLLT